LYGIAISIVSHLRENIGEKTENRLKDSASPYLLCPASPQPIDWHEWGEEAFARAQKEDKPMLLDIGAVWCHWCHVIDREKLRKNPAIAKIINEILLPVKGIAMSGRMWTRAINRRSARFRTGRLPLTGS